MDDGSFWVMETSKLQARIHKIPSELLDNLWGQFEPPAKTTRLPILSFNEDDLKKEKPPITGFPKNPEGGFILMNTMQDTGGLTLEMTVQTMRRRYEPSVRLEALFPLPRPHSDEQGGDAAHPAGGDEKFADLQQCIGGFGGGGESEKLKFHPPTQNRDQPQLFLRQHPALHGVEIMVLRIFTVRQVLNIER